MINWTSRELLDYKEFVIDEMGKLRSELKWYHFGKTGSHRKRMIKVLESELTRISIEIRRRWKEQDRA